MNTSKTASPVTKGNTFFSFKYVPPLLITLILIAGHLTFGILQGYKNILLSIGCSYAYRVGTCQIDVGNLEKSVKRLYHRYQCRHPDPVSFSMAFCPYCNHIHNVEICITVQEYSHLESIEFWYNLDVCPASVRCCRTEYTMG